MVDWFLPSRAGSSATPLPPLLSLAPGMIAASQACRCHQELEPGSKNPQPHPSLWLQQHLAQEQQISVRCVDKSNLRMAIVRRDGKSWAYSKLLFAILRASLGSRAAFPSKPKALCPLTEHRQHRLARSGCCSCSSSWLLQDSSKGLHVRVPSCVRTNLRQGARPHVTKFHIVCAGIPRPFRVIQSSGPSKAATVSTCHLTTGGSWSTHLFRRNCDTCLARMDPLSWTFGAESLPHRP